MHGFINYVYIYEKWTCFQHESFKAFCTYKEAVSRPPQKGEELNSTNVKSVILLLNFYTSDSNTVKAASDILSLRKTPTETQVQFAIVL